MNQDGSNLPHKHSFMGPQNQLDLNAYMNRNQPSGNNNFYRFQPISSHLREHLLGPLTGSIIGLTKPPEYDEPDPECNPRLQLFKDSMAVIKPLMSSKTSHLLTSQITEKPSSILNKKMRKEDNFTTENDHIKRPVPRKPHSFSGGSDQFTFGSNEFSLPAVQSSRMSSGKTNNRSISMLAMNNATKTDNEIIALKEQIDSLYSKLDEIQRKCDTTIQNLKENKESMLKNSNNITNIDGDSYETNSTTKSISCTTNENPQIDQFTTTSNQSDGRILKQPINGVICSVNSAEEKKLELSGKLFDTWENNNGQFRNAELKTSRICEKKISNERKEDDDIILVDYSQEMTKEQLEYNNQNSINNHLDVCNSVIPTETNKNPNSSEKCELRSFDDRMLKKEEDKLKDQYSSRASYKTETKDTIIAVKRIHECWDATYPSSPHIKMTKENFDTNIQHEKIIESSIPHLPQANHFLQTPTSMIGFQQPRIAFQPPVRFGPMLCFSNIPSSTENYSYFTHPHNSFSQSEPVPFLTSNHLPKQFIPTMTAPMQAYQHHPNPLLNIQFPPVGNTMNATTNCPTTNTRSHNNYMAKCKLSLKNRIMSTTVKRKPMNSKLRNASAQTIPPANSGSTNVSNVISFDHLTNEQNVPKNLIYSLQLPTYQQMLDMKKQSIPMGNLETLSRNEELQRIQNTCDALTIPHSTTMNNYNCFL
ncbi:unnamed protein product [Cercopithifilaria johnstoni]|uniref:Uncharacterized protein n=1 Tax=Cercopithifilaria johnstoni TaxID=2874296 RepID=A0A8J2QAE4_9BILA|nr:unnamed protein product [Cercopithifilaria johnstoni]